MAATGEGGVSPETPELASLPDVPSAADFAAILQRRAETIATEGYGPPVALQGGAGSEAAPSKPRVPPRIILQDGDSGGVELTMGRPGGEDPNPERASATADGGTVVSLPPSASLQACIREALSHQAARVGLYRTLDGAVKAFEASPTPHGHAALMSTLASITPSAQAASTAVRACAEAAATTPGGAEAARLLGELQAAEGNKWRLTLELLGARVTLAVTASAPGAVTPAGSTPAAYAAEIEAQVTALKSAITGAVDTIADCLGYLALEAAEAGEA